jgi:hypothetical protein
MDLFKKFAKTVKNSQLNLLVYSETANAPEVMVTIAIRCKIMRNYKLIILLYSDTPVLILHINGAYGIFWQFKHIRSLIIYTVL